MKWIPIEEKLPELGKRVLATIKIGDRFPWMEIVWYGKTLFKNKVCFYITDSEWGECEVRGVTAWMPLPKPYESNKEVHSDA